jgi:hypothetical protein
MIISSLYTCEIDPVLNIEIGEYSQTLFGDFIAAGSPSAPYGTRCGLPTAIPELCSSTVSYIELNEAIIAADNTQNFHTFLDDRFDAFNQKSV